jgi:hypothetical protein
VFEAKNFLEAPERDTLENLKPKAFASFGSGAVSNPQVLKARASGVKSGDADKEDKTPSALDVGWQRQAMLGLRTPFVATGRGEHRCSVCGACAYSPQAQPNP